MSLVNTIREYDRIMRIRKIRKMLAFYPPVDLGGMQ